METLYEWFRSEDNNIWSLTLRLDLSNVIWGHWPCQLHTYLLRLNWWYLLFFFGILRPNAWLIFYIDQFIGPRFCHSEPLAVCPQAIFLAMMTFHSGMLCITSILSRYRNSSKLNAETLVNKGAARWDERGWNYTPSSILEAFLSKLTIEHCNLSLSTFSENKQFTGLGRSIQCL